MPDQKKEPITIGSDKKRKDGSPISPEGHRGKEVLKLSFWQGRIGMELVTSKHWRRNTKRSMWILVEQDFASVLEERSSNL